MASNLQAAEWAANDIDPLMVDAANPRLRRRRVALAAAAVLALFVAGLFAWELYGSQAEAPQLRGKLSQAAEPATLSPAWDELLLAVVGPVFSPTPAPASAGMMAVVAATPAPEKVAAVEAPAPAVQVAEVAPAPVQVASAATTTPVEVVMRRGATTPEEAAMIAAADVPPAPAAKAQPARAERLVQAGPTASDKRDCGWGARSPEYCAKVGAVFKAHPTTASVVESNARCYHARPGVALRSDIPACN